MLWRLVMLVLNFCEIEIKKNTGAVKTKSGLCFAIKDCRIT
ncbi:hypothetical Protein YC6258_01753 [Gynuella sunshinyii YC6258]|uniref:Uncharacterized protein n=1 Tax=Gynuella sunshinyii YC6258 TaxID=1445510 RepID=A0A0C5VGT7_9GAMM|nr:hypothetical Protein YC6258_01753 [Gynuella sunshinyii YC6258]